MLHAVPHIFPGEFLQYYPGEFLQYCTGERLGVGLSAAAVPCTLNSSFYQTRFEAMARSSQKLGVNVSQISVWGKLAVNSLVHLHHRLCISVQ